MNSWVSRVIVKVEYRWEMKFFSLSLIQPLCVLCCHYLQLHDTIYVDLSRGKKARVKNFVVHFFFVVVYCWVYLTRLRWMKCVSLKKWNLKNLLIMGKWDFCKQKRVTYEYNLLPNFFSTVNFLYFLCIVDLFTSIRFIFINKVVWSVFEKSEE
jgi:hypothetical protein